jgi:hypothetical protein
MTEDRWEEELARLMDDHVTGTPCSRNDLDEVHAAESVELLDIADLLWEAAHGAPPLERDPVAAMLGLVPDSARSLSGAALKQALRAAGLQVSTLAQKLSDRGWDVATRDVFNWQTRDDAVVSPALIQAIAEVTGVEPGQLIVDRGESPTHRALMSVTSSTQFQALAERWARLRGTSVDLGASALESRLAASVFRGSQPDEVQMLASLEALVTALESETRSDKGH